MNISGLSTTIAATSNTDSAFGVAMLRNSLDSLETTGEGVIEMMEQSLNPHVGSNVDISL
ncbi:MAG: YjfB family protein [Eubacteriales bacterium]